ncbi:hypothetical protein [Chitinophaga sp. OAE865]|uniref:hypothetical protein n=1 Tax=Chitinophaga sp. OAE865 TaxID=2817898 RepID=UPI001AE2A570
MKYKKYEPSILLSIFRRKGGEGSMTKIISDENKTDFIHQLTFLQTDEQPLLCFKQDESNWLLITGDRIIEEKNGVTLFIHYSELVKVNIALHEEYKDGIKSVKDFTRLVLIDIHDRNHIVKLEKGEHYKGIFQLLHHVV